MNLVNQKGLAPIAIIIFLALLAAVGSIVSVTKFRAKNNDQSLLSNNPSPSAVPSAQVNNSPSPTLISNPENVQSTEYKATLESLKKYLGITNQPSKTSQFYDGNTWVRMKNNKKWFYYLKGEGFFTASKEQFGNSAVRYGVVTKYSDSNIENFANDVDTFFASKGYQANPLNTHTYKIINDPIIYVAGYSKGEARCLVSLKTSFFAKGGPFGQFFCGVEEKLNTAGSNDVMINGPEPNIVFEVTKIDGNFAKGNTFGSGWIAAKKNGVWELITYYGQSIRYCKVLDENNVPPSIMVSCLEKDGKIREYVE